MITQTCLLDDLGKTRFINRQILRVPGCHPDHHYHDHNHHDHRHDHDHDHDHNVQHDHLDHHHDDHQGENDDNAQVFSPLVRLIDNGNFDVWALLG